VALDGSGWKWSRNFRFASGDSRGTFYSQKSVALVEYIPRLEQEKLAKDLNEANKKYGFNRIFFAKRAQVHVKSVSSAFSMKKSITRRVYEALRRVLDEEIPKILTPKNVQKAIATAA